MSNLATPEVRQWHIYKITSPTGRIYIGKSANLASRLSAYRRKKFKDQPLLANSLMKYGLENHAFDILDSFVSNSSFAAGKEMFWIRTFMSFYTKWPEMRGMNLTHGGEGSLGVKKSQKQIDALRAKNIGRKQSDEQRKATSERHKGNKYSVGRKHTPEELVKMSEIHKKRIASPEEMQKRISASIKVRSTPVDVYNVSDGSFFGSYSSMQKAAIATGVNRNTVASSLSNKRKPYWYIFKYKQ